MRRLCDALAGSEQLMSHALVLFVHACACAEIYLSSSPPLQSKGIMASGEGTAITTQPRSKRKEVEQFIRDLDPTEVVGKFR